MSATLLSDIPQAVADELRAAYPDLRSAEVLPVRLSVKAFRDLGKPAPGAFVSFLGMNQGGAFGGMGDETAHEFNASMAVFIMTKRGNALARNAEALAIAKVAARLIPDNDWGMNEAGPAGGVKLVQVYDAEDVSREGIAVWGVLWTQPIVIGKAPEALPGPETFLSMAPDIGAENREKYERIGGEA